MKPYDFVHLALYAAGGHIEGRTKLQKLVYFVGALTGELSNLGYRPHYYGPFSPSVAGAVQELCGLQFLDQKISSEETRDDQGFEVARYDYVLTDAGKLVAAEKAATHSEFWSKLSDAMKVFQSARVDDYVRLSIAAKTHLINEITGMALSSDALREKAAEHGWTGFSQNQYEDAMTFLRCVGLSTANR